MMRRLCLAAAMLIAAPFIALAQDAGGLFDKPVKVERVPLPKDPLNPRAEPMLSCFYHAGGIVKQIDRGEKGAELSILPLDPGQPLPQCAEASAPGEKAVDNWSGYFKGIRADYAFFDADDGWNNGAGFAVFSLAAGRKLFDDVAETIHGIDATSAGLVLRYRRVYGAPCSLYADRAACWNKVKQETALAGDMPDCAAAYEADIAIVGAHKDGAAANPTIVTYEAETLLDSTGAVTKPLPGAMTCQPAM